MSWGRKELVTTTVDAHDTDAANGIAMRRGECDFRAIGVFGCGLGEAAMLALREAVGR
jgi:hypothetical protein